MRVCNRFVGTQVLRAAGICAMKAPTSGVAAAATATATAAPNPCEGQLSVFHSQNSPSILFIFHTPLLLLIKQTK